MECCCVGADAPLVHPQPAHALLRAAGVPRRRAAGLPHHLAHLRAVHRLQARRPHRPALRTRQQRHLRGLRRQTRLAEVSVPIYIHTSVYYSVFAYFVPFFLCLKHVVHCFRPLSAINKKH